MRDGIPLPRTASTSTITKKGTAWLHPGWVMKAVVSRLSTAPMPKAAAAVIPSDRNPPTSAAANAAIMIRVRLVIVSPMLGAIRMPPTPASTEPRTQVPAARRLTR